MAVDGWDKVLQVPFTVIHQ